MKIVTSNLAIHIVTIEERKKKVWGIRSLHEKEVHVNTDFFAFIFFFYFIFSTFILYVIVKYQKFKHFSEKKSLSLFFLLKKIVFELISNF